MRGLTDVEARARLAAEGRNALPEPERRTWLRLLLDVAREPMFVLLVAAAALYFALGDAREAWTLASFVLVVVAITVVQEGRTERALSRLRDLSSPRARVVRDGAERTIAASELVRGDAIRLEEGDRVPADAILREGGTLTVDESLLSGESVPVARHADGAARELGAPGAAGSASVFSGTLILAGRGSAEVAATGLRSALGQIGASLRDVERVRTPLQREVDRAVRVAAIGGVGLALGLFLAQGFSDGGWLSAALAAIALAMALLPEEFPVVLTVFLALGAWRIAKARVLARRVAAVEALGSVDVLCTDKTGTLTENRMAVRHLVGTAGEVELEPGAVSLPEEVHALVEASILASPRQPFDPMERAFLELGQGTLRGTEHLHPQWEPLREYPLTAELLAVTWAWRPDQSARGARFAVATKGAPEAVFDLCHLEPAELERWRGRATELARRGLRVLAVARGGGAAAPLPDHPHDFDFALAGLVGLADPLRGDVGEAVRSCRRAGVRVIMVTGDHRETARAVARAAGIDAGAVLSGAELEQMDDAALARALEGASVVARAVPAHKLRIVRALQARGRVVAMTGDGVNDAPALKAADVGIAMGKRGTDVAREAAALVLVEDDFGSIVEAVRIGRRVDDNLRKSVGYIVAVHVPIAGLALVPPLLGWDALLTPTLVVLLELVIDPSCSIVFEREPAEADVMARPPRGRAARLFDARGLSWSAAQGALVLAGTLAVVAWARGRGESDAAQRTLAFAMLAAGNVAILLANRSLTEPVWRTFGRWNPAVPVLLGAVAVMVGAILALGSLRAWLGFGAIAPPLAAVGLLVAAVPVLLLDVVKLRSHRATAAAGS